MLVKIKGGDGSEELGRKACLFALMRKDISKKGRGL